MLDCLIGGWGCYTNREIGFGSFRSCVRAKLCVHVRERFANRWLGGSKMCSTTVWAQLPLFGLGC